MRKKVLVVFPNVPVSESGEGGGGLVILNHIKLLKSHFDEIHLLLIRTSDEPDRFDEYFASNTSEFQELNKLITTKSSIELTIKESKGRFRNYFYFIFHPTEWALPFINVENRSKLLSIIAEVHPDVIWAEHFLAASLCYHSGANRQQMIYAHHDWEYKLRKYRLTYRNTVSYGLRSAWIKKLEIQMVKTCGGVITASWSEYQECKALGTQKSIYLPLFVDSPVLQKRAELDNNPKIYHLGGMKTTANRAGLINFYNNCWPALRNEFDNLQLILVGSLAGAEGSDDLLALLKDPSVESKGYVKNIDVVLNPMCIHIIPWNQNTGVRTKVPIALRNSQIIVGMRPALQCFKELENDKNAMIVSDFSEMTGCISRLLKDPNKRHAIGTESYHTFDQHYRFEAQSKPFADFINNFV